MGFAALSFGHAGVTVRRVSAARCPSSSSRAVGSARGGPEKRGRLQLQREVRVGKDPGGTPCCGGGNARHRTWRKTFSDFASMYKYVSKLLRGGEQTAAHNGVPVVISFETVRETAEVRV